MALRFIYTLLVTVTFLKLGFPFNTNSSQSSLLLNTIKKYNIPVTGDNVYFDLADLSIDIKNGKQITRLEGFRSGLNDAILREANSDKYSQLLW